MQLVQVMMQHLDVITDELHRKLCKTFEWMFDEIKHFEQANQWAISETEEHASDQASQGEGDGGKLTKYRYQKLGEIWCIPNRIDCDRIQFRKVWQISVVKKQLVTYFVEKDIGIYFVVKKNKNFMCMKAVPFKFIDFMNYLALGVSYDK